MEAEGPGHAPGSGMTPGGGAGGAGQGAAAPSRFRPPPLRLLLGLLIALCVAAAAIAGFRGMQTLRSLESGLNDRLRVILSPYSETQDPRISILTVTEDTLALFPYRSPVDRDFLADLIILLNDAGVAAIGLDILIDQPTEPAKDQRLIEAIRDFPGTLVLAWADARAGLRPAQEAFLADFMERSGAIPGFATVRYDPDGVVRRFESTLPGAEPMSFSAALLTATDQPLFPTEGLVDWRRETPDGSPAFQKIASQILLNPAMPRAMFRNWFAGRYVMIGADLEQTDRHQTSLSVDPTISNRTNPGVLLHAHVLSQMLDGREVRDFDVRGWPGAAIVAVMALIGAGIGIWGGALYWRLAALAAAGIGYAALAVWLSSLAGPYLPVAPALIAFVVAFAIGGATEAFLSSREKQFIRMAFSHYLEPAMVDRLARDRSSLRLGGERREISFIFTDVAGFTDMSETLEPEVLAELLNGYFDGMSDIIAWHSGTIDKFIGDAVVALFGAMTQEPDHALNAIRCAAEMDAFAEDYRRANAHLGLGVTRIGVHTGVASVGNFGGRRRFHYTAMGDAMNTAARLESINKRLGTRITVSEAARLSALRYADETRGLAELRPVGRVMLKGKVEPVAVWNLDRLASQATRDAYGAAFARIATGNWAQGGADGAAPDPAAALTALERLATAPDAPSDAAQDPLVRLHLERLRAGERDDRIV